MAAVAESFPLPETSTKDTWPQSLVSNFLSFNLSQYKSNHHKQHLLILESKIFHFLPQLQIRKSKKKIHLRSACDYEFHTPRIPSHFQSTFFKLLAEDIRRIFPSLGPRRKVLNPPSCSHTLRSLDLHQKPKDEFLDSPCVPHPWIKQEHKR